METKGTVKTKMQINYLKIEKYAQTLFCLLAWSLLLSIIIQVSLIQSFHDRWILD